MFIISIYHRKSISGSKYLLLKIPLWKYFPWKYVQINMNINYKIKVKFKFNYLVIVNTISDNKNWSVIIVITEKLILAVG